MKMQRIVWFEGMKLDPHHFQQADRYNQYYINKRLTLINSNYWGLKEIQIDNAALAGGVFNLIACSGVMPDGMLFNIPKNLMCILQFRLSMLQALIFNLMNPGK